MDSRPRIIDFIRRFIGNYDLDEDDDIFELGLVTSLFAMELVTFVENEFAIEVATEDLDLSNFSTVNALARFVERKRVTPSPSSVAVRAAAAKK